MTNATIAVLGLVAIVAVAAVGWVVVDGALVIVDPTKTYQTMKGWEVSVHLWEQNKQEDRYDGSWLDYRDQLLPRLVNELGIDRVRIEIRSGAENPVDYWTAFENGKIGYEEAKSHRYEVINDNDDPNIRNQSGFQFAELDYRVDNVLRPMKRLVEANGEKLFVNLIYVDFSKYTRWKGNLSHARQPDEYAELILATFEHLRGKYSIVPDALEIVLEPDNSDDWRGREIGAAMVAAAKRLNRAGFFPQIIAPSTARAHAASAYIDAMMQVPGVAGLITTFAYHRYDAPVASASLTRIRERAKKFGVETAMLEHLAGDVAELHVDLTELNVVSWQQYGIAYRNLPDRDRKGGYFYLVDVDKREVKTSSRTPALAQYFKFVRAGAIRIDAVSNRADKKAAAFKNPDGAHVVIVQADRQGGTISVAGLPGGSYGVRYTTAEEIARELAAVTIGPGQALTARLPAKGVITFYQRPVR
jgi:hypothetical protein